MREATIRSTSEPAAQRLVGASIETEGDLARIEPERPHAGAGEPLTLVDLDQRPSRLMEKVPGQARGSGRRKLIDIAEHKSFVNRA